MKLDFRNIGKDFLIAYLVVAINFVGGFKATFNPLNWSSKEFYKFIILFAAITFIMQLSLTKRNLNHRHIFFF